MNLYVRFFDRETLVGSVDEVIDFLSSIPGIIITPDMAADIQAYAESEMPYPKRYKVRPRIYFILIKTVARTLAEFKMHKKAPAGTASGPAALTEQQARKENKLTQLGLVRPGWYEGTIVFKRVIPIAGTGKFQYQDTRFSAYVKAQSALHCYERMVDHLKNRQDVDLRSQFPSAKGNSYTCRYIGDTLPGTATAAPDAPQQAAVEASPASQANDAPLFDGQYCEA